MDVRRVLAGNAVQSGSRVTTVMMRMCSLGSGERAKTQAEFARGEDGAAEPGCFRAQTDFATGSNVSGPGSTPAPAAKRRAKAVIYNSRTMRVPDDLSVMNSAPFRSS